MQFRRIELATGATVMEALSPVGTYSEPVYASHAVQAHIDEIKSLFGEVNVPKLAIFLATTQLPPAAVSAPRYTDRETPGTGACAKSDVDAYLTELRSCVDTYLRSCAESPDHPSKTGVPRVPNER